MGFCRGDLATETHPPPSLPLEGGGVPWWAWRSKGVCWGGFMQGQCVAASKLFAKDLRKGMTDAEQKLWQHLRGRQLGVRFRRQHPFEGYILDFVCLECRLVVEVDGGQHAGAFGQDAARTEFLTRAGFRVLRFWNNEVLTQTDAVVGCIAQHLGC